MKVSCMCARDVAVVALACVTALPCAAQPVSSTPVRPAQAPTAILTAPPKTETRTVRQSPSFRLFGMPVQLNAPVSPPYAGSAYQMLAGQPETGADVIAGQNAPDAQAFANPTPP